jgi:hypothetical protein
MATHGMSPILVEKLEALSAYRPLFAPSHPRASDNPPAYGHVRVRLAGKAPHVLSRVCAAGLDYSGRSNVFAHHLVLDACECPAGGPAWLLQQGLLARSWNGQVQELAAERTAPKGDRPPSVCRAWHQHTGDAGWAAVLADSFLGNPGRVAYLVYEPGKADLLELFAEAIALLPASQRWAVTFSTYYTGLSQEVSCQWRAVVHGSPQIREARRLPGALVLDLTTKMPAAPEASLTSLARTGVAARPAAVEPRPEVLLRSPAPRSPILEPREPATPAVDVLAEMDVVPPEVYVTGSGDQRQPRQSHRRLAVVPLGLGLGAGALLGAVFTAAVFLLLPKDGEKVGFENVSVSAEGKDGSLGRNDKTKDEQTRLSQQLAQAKQKFIEDIKKLSDDNTTLQRQLKTAKQERDKQVSRAVATAKAEIEKLQDTITKLKKEIAIAASKGGTQRPITHPAPERPWKSEAQHYLDLVDRLRNGDHGNWVDLGLDPGLPVTKKDVRLKLLGLSTHSRLAPDPAGGLGELKLRLKKPQVGGAPGHLCAFRITGKRLLFTWDADLSRSQKDEWLAELSNCVVEIARTDAVSVNYVALRETMSIGPTVKPEIQLNFKAPGRPKRQLFLADAGATLTETTIRKEKEKEGHSEKRTKKAYSVLFLAQTGQKLLASVAPVGKVWVELDDKHEPITMRLRVQATDGKEPKNLSAQLDFAFVYMIVEGVRVNIAQIGRPKAMDESSAKK